MFIKPSSLSTENQYDEQAFVFQMKDEYIKRMGDANQGSKDQLPDVVKLDFERLADFIRFEALKNKKLITIDRIKDILSVKR